MRLLVSIADQVPPARCFVPKRALQYTRKLLVSQHDVSVAESLFQGKHSRRLKEAMEISIKYDFFNDSTKLFWSSRTRDKDYQDVT